MVKVHNTKVDFSNVLFIDEIRPTFDASGGWSK